MQRVYLSVSMVSCSSMAFRSPDAAARLILTSESVVPDMADSTVIRACSRRTISATFFMFAAEPTDVPPNFNTLII